MAEMMGITVEELRNQSPEEHMQMMQEMMRGGGNGMMNHGGMMNGGAEDFIPGAGVDIESLPYAKPSDVIEVSDGDTISLSPTLVRKNVNGKDFVMYGYNGQVPGPVIKAKQAATITVEVTNKIDMETTIHWHGIRLDNENDGIPDVTQEPIQSGGNFRYTVKLPDEGIYWYHPHVREDIQQDLGLYGNILVAPTEHNAYEPVHSEQTLILDDLLLTSKAVPDAYGSNGATYPLMGRFGNVMLINGDPDYELSVPKGSVIRFYLTNVANTRTFRVHFSGAKMKRVGSDVGRYEQEEWVDAITIAPAERYVVDVLFENQGTYAFTHESPLATYKLGAITVTDQQANPSLADSFQRLRTHQDVVADIDAYRSYFDKPIDKTLRLDIEMGGMMNHGMMMAHTDDGIEWEDAMPGMNAMMSNQDLQWKLVDEETGHENMDINWMFQKGDVVKIRIINNEHSAHPMQHPIHLHGQRFLVLETDGQKNENLVWKDTVLVPTGATTDILVDMSNPGDWMFHCHIAEHLTNGMMGMFHVSE